jgi:hypothetical protein
MLQWWAGGPVGLGDWVHYYSNSECRNGCCSGMYSGGVPKCPTFAWLDLDHLKRLGAGHNAPETPSAEMDAAAAVVCTPAVYPNVCMAVRASWSFASAEAVGERPGSSIVQLVIWSRQHYTESYQLLFTNDLRKYIHLYRLHHRRLKHSSQWSD